MPCFLDQLDHDFSDTLLGLNIDSEANVDLSKRIFSCCVKQGRTVLGQTERLRVCDVQDRLMRIRALLALFQATWNMPFPFYDQRSNPQLQEMISSLWKNKQVSDRGLIFRSRKTQKGPSAMIWLLALASTWKYGVSAYVVTLGRLGLTPVTARSPSDNVAVFVDQCSPMRHPNVLNDFDTVVNWCDGAMLPMWLDVFSESGPISQGEEDVFDAKAAFTRRIAKHRSQPPLSWASQQTLSRLSSVSLGIGPFSV